MFDEDEVYQEEVRNRKPPKRAQSTLSSIIEAGRSQSPHATAPGLSGPLSGGDSAKIQNAGNASRPAAENEASLPSTSSGDDKRRYAEVAHQVIERLRTPMRRSVASTATLQTESGPQSRVSSDTVAEVNARFQPPRRSKTSSSLVPARGRPPSLQRSRTLGLAIDLEAQVSVAKRPRTVTFAAEPVDRLTIPTYTIPGRERQAGADGHAQVLKPPQRTQPSIFRPQSTLRDEVSSGSLAITPRRLPTTQTLLPKQAPGDEKRLPNPTRRDDPDTSLVSRVRSRLAASRIEKDLERIQPFFEWRTAATTPSTPRGPAVNTLAQEARNENGFALPELRFNGDESTSGHTLDILDLEMNNPYELSEDFPIQPQHYLGVQEATIHEVIKELERQPHGLEQSSTSKDSSEAQRFWDTKLSILLNVDTIMSCFIGNNELPKPIVGKIWGIVLSICRVPLEEVRHPLARREVADILNRFERPQNSFRMLATSL